MLEGGAGSFASGVAGWYLAWCGLNSLFFLLTLFFFIALSKLAGSPFFGGKVEYPQKGQLTLSLGFSIIIIV